MESRGLKNRHHLILWTCHILTQSPSSLLAITNTGKPNNSIAKQIRFRNEKYRVWHKLFVCDEKILIKRRENTLFDFRFRFFVFYLLWNGKTAKKKKTWNISLTNRRRREKCWYTDIQFGEKKTIKISSNSKSRF